MAVGNPKFGMNGADAVTVVDTEFEAWRLGEATKSS
jgi:hypothetical protein